MSRTTNLQELKALVTQWGTDRNFFAANGATYEGQWVKLFEEAGELAQGIAKKKPKVIKDSIGDMLVVCIMLQGIAHRDDTLTNLMAYELFAQVGVFNPAKASTHLYFIANELCWLSPDNHSTNYKGSYLQRMVSNLSSIAALFGFTIIDCLEDAYKEIKDRKGSMIDGVFIKEQDL